MIRMIHRLFCSKALRTAPFITGLSVLAVFLFPTRSLAAQRQQIVWSEQEKPIVQHLRGLRQLADDTRLPWHSFLPPQSRS
jgi:hypothetical protein